MLDFFPYKKLTSYPHMMPEDVAIWERFIEKFPDAYDKVQYDLNVGKIPSFITDEPEEAQRKQAILYQRKIDVVGFKGTDIDVVELKPRAGTSSLGQVKGYVQLYIRDVNQASRPKPVVITDVFGLDMEALAFGAGVTLIVV